MSALLVTRVGPLVTVQDRGRRGVARFGIPPSGPLDRATFDAAVAAVGAPGDAALEIPLAAARFVAVGALTVSIDGDPPIALADGEELEVPQCRRAVRYLAIAGGLDVAPVLGSRATLVTAGLGGFEGRALRKGDRLAVGLPATPSLAPVSLREAVADEAGDAPTTLALMPLFDAEEETLETLFAAVLRVDPRSNRVGVRLSGSGVLAPRGERQSRPIAPGALQLPPDGQPIVIGPDGPTTGGYPVVAVLPRESRDRLARLRPGARVRFARTRETA